MVDVGQQKKIYVKWKLFSLRIINKDRKTPEDYAILHKIGLKALRVAAAVRHDYGNEGVGKLYTAMGTLYHHDEEDIDDVVVRQKKVSITPIRYDLTDMDMLQKLPNWDIKK